ncbi:MAG TPA: nucleotide excision repair endonuclease [Verrucomicrobiae bacterium]|nr:nucleotide excision repair endonuclease [Verrucomicrobiae bacterium]
MPAQQLHLFKPAKPLLLRFGAEFFRAIPAKPGVYIMGGEAERILYVGQSKNLRRRLASYKNARPDRCARKIIRLVHSVRSIVWEECGSPENARLKENELLRIHRPKFNRVNTYPQAYRFIGIERANEKLVFRLLNDANATGNIFGAFKSGCARAYASLLRLLWTTRQQPLSPFDFPAPLLAAKPPREYFVPIEARTSDWTELMEKFFAGESDVLLAALANALPKSETICAFQRNLHLNDLEILTEFFEHGPKRNRSLREHHGLREPLIAKEQLDDLLITAVRKS